MSGALHKALGEHWGGTRRHGQPALIAGQITLKLRLTFLSVIQMYITSRICSEFSAEQVGSCPRVWGSACGSKTQNASG